MKIEYINPLLNSLKETFTSMVQKDVTIGKPYVVKEKHFLADINAVIDFTGEGQPKGKVCLSLPLKVSQKIVSKLVFQELEEDDPLLYEGVGELVNIITGYAKKELTDKKMSLGLPSILKKGELVPFEIAPVIAIPLQTEDLKFCMTVSM